MLSKVWKVYLCDMHYHKSTRYSMCLMMVHCLRIAFYFSRTLQQLSNVTRLFGPTFCCMLDRIKTVSIRATCKSHEITAIRANAFMVSRLLHLKSDTPIEPQVG